MGHPPNRGRFGHTKTTKTIRASIRAPIRAPIGAPIRAPFGGGPVHLRPISSGAIRARPCETWADGGRVGESVACTHDSGTPRRWRLWWRGSDQWWRRWKLSRLLRDACSVCHEWRPRQTRWCAGYARCQARRVRQVHQLREARQMLLQPRQVRHVRQARQWPQEWQARRARRCARRGTAQPETRQTPPG